MPGVSALGKLFYSFPFGDERLDTPSNQNLCWQGEEDLSEMVSRGYQASEYGMLYGNARVNTCIHKEQNHEHHHRCT